MILLGALAVIGVIVALFISAKKRSVDVVTLVPPEAEVEGPAVPKRLSSDKQAVRPMNASPAPVAPEPPAPKGVIAPDHATRRALAAENRAEAVKLYAAQTGLDLERARTTLDAIMSGSIPIESLVFNAAARTNVDEESRTAIREGRTIDAIMMYREKKGVGLAEAKRAIETLMVSDTAPRANIDDAIQSALRAGNKIEAIKLYREKTGLGLAEAKSAIDAMMNGATPPPLPPRAAPVNLDAAIQNAVRAGNKIEAIKLYREKTGLGLKEAKHAIDALFSGGPPPQRTAPPSPSSGNLDAAIDAAIRADQLIQAIKLYREKTGLGLAEAKRAVEARRDQLRR